MSPPYVFRVEEIHEHPNVRPIATTTGHWQPSIFPGYNYRCGGGVSHIYWFCDRQRIRAIPPGSVPQQLEHFKTFSIFFSAGLGFWVLQGDGTAPDPDQAWRPLRFDAGPNGSAYLTPTGGSETLLCQRTDQIWAHRLLPNIYHGPQTQDPGQGGLCGELPIFLALAAMSMEPQFLQQWLPWMYQDSRWHMHSLTPGWQHGRGVVVNVYTCPNSWAGGSNAEDLIAFEEGDLGKYYY